MSSADEIFENQVQQAQRRAKKLAQVSMGEPEHFDVPNQEDPVDDYLTGEVDLTKYPDELLSYRSKIEATLKEWVERLPSTSERKHHLLHHFGWLWLPLRP